jgi:3-mercaptopyruvate sulfurtransferase SseA
MRGRVIAIALIPALAVAVWLGITAGAARVQAAGQYAQARTPADVRRITLDEFKKLHAANQVIVVDVRGPDSFRQGHIPGSLLIPLETVENRAGELKGVTKTVVTYCA